MRNEEITQLQASCQRAQTQLNECLAREKEQSKTYRQKLVSLELECIQLKGELLDRHGKHHKEGERETLN